MDIKELLTSFQGRISRKQFWIGILCLIVIIFALIVILGLTLGLFLPTSIVSIIGTFIAMYPACALYSKRLHDRGKSTTPWLWIFIVPGLLYTVASNLSIGFSMVALVPGTSPTPTPDSFFGYLITTMTAIVGIWALIELGFLSGSKGANDYGPDPTSE